MHLAGYGSNPVVSDNTLFIKERYSERPPGFPAALGHLIN